MKTIDLIPTYLVSADSSALSFVDENMLAPDGPARLLVQASPELSRAELVAELRRLADSIERDDLFADATTPVDTCRRVPATAARTA